MRQGRVNRCKGTKSDIGFLTSLDSVRENTILVPTEIIVKLGYNFGR